MNTIALHPTIDVLVTAGRDSTARVWDVRTKANVYTLTGHTNTIASVVTQAAEPQVSLKWCVLYHRLPPPNACKIAEVFLYFTFAYTI